MSQKKKDFKNFFSLISYQKKNKPKDFMIPEADTILEASSTHKESQPSTPFTYDGQIQFLHKAFNYPVNKDIVIREFLIGNEHKAFLAYIDGMANSAIINDFILRPLLSLDVSLLKTTTPKETLFKSVLQTSNTQSSKEPDEIIDKILTGDTLFYMDGWDFYLVSETKGFEKRSVEKPMVESVVKGPQEAFNENLKTNLTLVRRIIKNNSLTTEYFKVGERNNNLCALMYIDGLVNPVIVEEVKRRIGSIKTDFLMGDGMLEQFIEDNPYCIIPLILSTERPDRVASHLVEGRVAIIAEGTPFALVVPVSIFSFFHTSEDASLKWQFGSVVRVLRILAFLGATLLPGFYVALTNFHREMIPTDLLIAIAKSREAVPFPTIVELIFMELSFELIREAGVRIPGIIGNTIGIIGGLILGQAAVQANLVSPILVIIIALTGLGNFAVPNFSLAFSSRILRIAFILIAAFIGFYGITILIMAILGLLINLKSFGVPIFAPVSPVTKEGADTLFRRPVWKQETRPDYVNPLDKRRQPKISRGWTKDDPSST
jgi:spore germination protein KA